MYFLLNQLGEERFQNMLCSFSLTHVIPLPELSTSSRGPELLSAWRTSFRSLVGRVSRQQVPAIFVFLGMALPLYLEGQFC